MELVLKESVSSRFKIIYWPFFNVLSIKDKKKEIKFKATYWSGGNITMKYKKKNSLYWEDLGFNGNVYNIDQIKRELNHLVEEENNQND